MRKARDIVAYYITHKDEDFLGFVAEALLPFLSFEQAKPLLKPDATPENWASPEPLTGQSVLAVMEKYMSFAWGKVKDHRGISAGRSVEKMGAWLWLLGDDDLVAVAHDGENYAQYGAPILKKICEKYGFPVPDDEGVLRMAQGKPCQSGCRDGCDK